MVQNKVTVLPALALLTCLWATSSFAQPAGLVCSQRFQVSQGATALTKIVTNQAGKSISLCGYNFSSGAATSTAKLVYGTGTNCGDAGAVDITPAFNLGISQSMVDHLPYAFYSIPAGSDLCLVTTGTGPTQVLVYYGLF